MSERPPRPSRRRYYCPDVLPPLFAPSAPGAFDPNIPEEGPSAPPPGFLDDVHGYLGHKGEGDHPLYPPPPAYVPQPELNKNTLVPEVKVPTVSEDVAREALLKFVESKWRYSSKPARNMVFKQLKPITVYRVRAQAEPYPSAGTGDG
ncbi:protein SSUH2 homolog [Notothenia coriiceps]|uniref:Protein SSUH2 homolog n=1 Tax=Notothenia coriiceps TaxID=8208 RepID=A0A6I9PXY8_9TELE|nr:PREDICTED: protein SSUH2 homolog [Notothenia coriiceps]